LAVAEAKFIFKFISTPWQSDRMKYLQAALRQLISRITSAFTPTWLANLTKKSTKLDRFLNLVLILRNILVYVYSAAVMK